jgi:thioredoxin-dependent peroxiredoxin
VSLIVKSLAVAMTYCSCSYAALDLGERAPDFTASASIAGNVFQFKMADALRQGPVVLYFFPLAFSADCSIEAHEFAEAVDDYKKLGATVIGVSRDDIETQKRFGATECRGKFAVVADPDQAVMKAYDAVMALKPDFANRVSYVISPEGTVVYQYTSLNPTRHVQKTLGALRQWFSDRPKDGKRQ